MDDRRALLRHYLAALAYRTQKALRDAPEDFGTFRSAPGTRTPVELVRHIPERLGPDRAQPARPDAIWPEAPPGWEPPARR